MAVEAKRGCGYRKAGGLYLVGGGLARSCDRIPFRLDRCRTCGAGIKFTRSHTWLQPDFFEAHKSCHDDGSCPICHNREFGPHLLLWIGRSHYTPQEFLDESHKLGISRRIPAIPKGLIIGETWVLVAHLDAVPPSNPGYCAKCGKLEAKHVMTDCDYEEPKPTPGIFSAFIPRAVELVLKESDATDERIEKEAKRGVTVVKVPDNDKDHQGSVWDKEEDGQEELPGMS